MTSPSFKILPALLTSFLLPQTFKGNTDRNTVVYHRLTQEHLNDVIDLYIHPSSTFGCMACDWKSMNRQTEITSCRCGKTQR